MKVAERIRRLHLIERLQRNPGLSEQLSIEYATVKTKESEKRRMEKLVSRKEFVYETFI